MRRINTITFVFAVQYNFCGFSEVRYITIVIEPLSWDHGAMTMGLRIIRDMTGNRTRSGGADRRLYLHSHWRHLLDLRRGA